ncbi:PaaI family thioesterase [Photobacterium alginatilyticum]|uniref:PaaI family thioesterase n=1 Tax=Photobacterium alginatilyticum TaxID=1775171 RepID=UPI0040689DA3
MTSYQVTKQAHNHCMVCGPVKNNLDTLQLVFSQDSEGKVTAPFQVTARHQGYDGMLHGGMTSTLLDAAMTHCLFAHGVQALTAELKVRFISPVCTGQQVRVTADLVGSRRGIYQLEAQVTQGQQVLARASAKFIEPKK